MDNYFDRGSPKKAKKIPATTDVAGRTSFQRMQRGLPPIGTDGRAVILHYIPEQNAHLEMLASEHQSNFSLLHTKNKNYIHGVAGGKK